MLFFFTVETSFKIPIIAQNKIETHSFRFKTKKLWRNLLRNPVVMVWREKKISFYFLQDSYFSELGDFPLTFLESQMKLNRMSKCFCKDKIAGKMGFISWKNVPIIILESLPIWKSYIGNSNCHRKLVN